MSPMGWEALGQWGEDAARIEPLYCDREQRKVHSLPPCGGGAGRGVNQAALCATIPSPPTSRVSFGPRKGEGRRTQRSSKASVLARSIGN